MLHDIPFTCIRAEQWVNKQTTWKGTRTLHLFGEFYVEEYDNLDVLMVISQLLKTNFDNLLLTRKIQSIT